MSNLKQLADAIAKLHKVEWELTSLRHDLQRQYEVLERQEASALELDIPEDEILATLVKDFPTEMIRYTFYSNFEKDICKIMSIL